ncbi:MAG: hypothetical protein A2145_01790 [candidate division Zixibacteria bacterium RBG_16_40_9]|nr:MAG: hypothetical protein A2145_01790 [candidate division Zixibacteria bacterium RBG_16_40_9]
MLKIWDYIFLLRPVLMLPGWSIILLAHHISSQNSDGTERLILTFLAATLLYGGVYVLNQIFDRETDRINKKLFFVSEGYISLNSAIWITVLCSAASLILSFYLSLTLGILFGLIFILSIFYSVPLISFKNKPWPGLLANGFGFGVLNFLVGWCISSEFSFKAILFSIPYFLAVSSIFLYTTLLDTEGDKRVNKITLGIKWGLTKSLGVSFTLILATLISAILLKDFPMITTSAISILLSLRMVTSKKIKDIILTDKISILILSLWAGYFYPWYVGFLILGLLGTKIYYKQRFQVNYPV